MAAPNVKTGQKVEVSVFHKKTFTKKELEVIGMDGNSSSLSAKFHPGDWKGWPLWDRCLCWDHTVCTWKVDW